jgi:hypothetical protein
MEPREAATELRCVAPLVVLGGSSPELVGPCTLVTNGTHTIALSSSELLRRASDKLAIAMTLDGSKTIPVPGWFMGRQTGVGIIDLGKATGFTEDVTPLQLGAVCATVETRGAPAALITFARENGRFTRRIIPVHVDAVDGGMSDEVIARLASPLEVRDSKAEIEGSPLFAWMPPDQVLGRPSEVVAVALALPYRTHAFKPRDQPAIGELVGLEDAGRALPWTDKPSDALPSSAQVAGEIADETEPVPRVDPERDE